MIPEDSMMDKIARRGGGEDEIFASKRYDFDLFAKNLLKVERSFAGRSRWDQNYEKDIQLSILCLSLSLLFSFYMIGNTISSIDLVGEITSTDRLLFSIGVSAAWFMVAWMITISFIKRSKIVWLEFKDTKFPIPWIGGTALIGILSSLILLSLVQWTLDLTLITSRWDIIWANRASVMIGPNLTEAMTQDYLDSENWRLWPVFYLVCAIIGLSYGSSKIKIRSFIPAFGLIATIIITFAGNSHEANYNVDKIILRLILGSLLIMICFFGMRLYSNKVEEYKINKAKRNIGILTVSTFFFTIFILNPPEIIASIAKVISDNITFLEPIFEPLTREGVKPSQWGGLLINLMVAAAGCVLGFVIGVILAFWRQSNLPILKWPGIAIIEIVRSGPLICWLYFAMYLLPDVADPLFTNPEDFDNILRMMAIFSIFGGCYIAEVIRGGLQAVDKGQKEAAVALGLSPLQTKLQVELPNAVRTTLPSIVSVFIGLWKDTTLLFIIEIIDFFRISKTMANTDLRFLGDFLEPVYFTALVFWIFAFYLSRVSMGVEKGLGLVKEGGGDAT